MALSATQTSIVQLVVGMFNAAPGKDILADLETLVNGGRSLDNLTNDLAGTGAFKSMYPSSMTDNAFAVAFINNLVGSTLTDANKAIAVQYTQGQLNSGLSRAQTIKAVSEALVAIDNADVNFGTASLTLENKLQAAANYSETQSSTDVAVLQGAISGVTEDPATIPPVVVVPVAGTTFTLTVNADTILGTAADDIFNAAVVASGGVASQSTLNPLDNLDGGDGTDTLIVETASVITGTFSNIENLTLIGPGNVNAGSAVDVSDFSGVIKLQQTDDLAVALNNVKGQTIATDRIADGTVVTATMDADQTSVALQSMGALGDTEFAVTGAKLTGVTLSVDGTKTAKDVTINNAANTVKNVTIDASAKSAVEVSTTALENVTVTGDGALTLNGTAASKVIDATASKGGVTVNTIMDNAAEFKGGEGKDTIAVAATTKAHNLGAGDDTVNLGPALGATGSVDGGEGTDTLAMSANNAAGATVASTLEKTVANFEVLSIGAVATGATDTINLANLDDISMVKSAGTAAEIVTNAAVKEIQTLTIASVADANGGILTVGGVDIQIGDAVGTAAIQAAIVAQSVAIIAANPTLESVTVGGANEVVFTHLSTAGPVPEITVVENPSGVTIGALTDNVVASGAPGAEVQVLTFASPAAQSGSFQVAGISIAVLVADTATTSATNVAAALTAAIAALNPLVANLATATSAAGVVTLTYKDDLASNNVADASLSGDDAIYGAANVPTFGGGVTAAGTDGTGETQTFTVTGSDVTGGQIIIGGVKIAVAGGLSADAVGSVIVANLAAIKAANPTVDSIGYNTTGSVVSINYTQNSGDVALITAISNDDHSAGATPVTGQTVLGELLVGTAAGVLNITNMATGGTLELTGALNGASSVVVKDASTTATDIFNIKLNGAAAINNTASLTVANIETINIEATDSTSSSDPTVASALDLHATATTTVNVTGNHGVNFSGHMLTSLTTLDASGVTATGAAGSVTFAASTTNKDISLTGGSGNDSLSGSSTSDATKVVTIDGGAGNDVITGGAGKDVLVGGAGNDTITGGAKEDTLTGGAGNDIFVLNSTADSVLAARDVIADFSANTFGNGAAGAAGTGATLASATNFTGDTLNLTGLITTGASAVNVDVFTNAANAQTYIQNQAGGTNGAAAALDSTTGLLYMDITGNDGVIDSVVELTGVTTIDAAAFITA